MARAPGRRKGRGPSERAGPGKRGSRSALRGLAGDARLHRSGTAAHVWGERLMVLFKVAWDHRLTVDCPMTSPGNRKARLCGPFWSSGGPIRFSLPPAQNSRDQSVPGLRAPGAPAFARPRRRASRSRGLLLPVHLGIPGTACRRCSLRDRTSAIAWPTLASWLKGGQAPPMARGERRRRDPGELATLEETDRAELNRRAVGFGRHAE
jgi:hypothetical protein